MEPIYEQIVAQIKAEVIEGRMTAGDALPSVRALSRELKISALTVKKAYDNLEEEGLIVTTVRDFGIVIPESEWENVFEKFYRVDNSRSTGTGVAGLGLAIAKEIVELHDGQIIAKSDDLHTQFIVTLPSENELEENEEGRKNEIHTHRRHTFGGRPVHWKLPKGKAGKGDMDQS